MRKDEKRKQIEAASLLIERVFADTGHLTPIFHVMTENKVVLVPLPEARTKDLAFAAAKAVFAELGAKCVLFMCEAYVREITKGARRPDRIEVVMFSCEDELGVLQAWRRIVRQKRGKAKLGPLEFKEFTELSGRAFGFVAPTGVRH